MNLRGTEIVVGASIGIAVSDGTADPADIERDADIALYDAKFAGKGQVAMFHTDMHDSAVQRLSLTNQLRGALDRDEISVCYQPIVDLATGALNSVEALIRWQNAERGLVMPNEFIPLAEETGLIVPLGEWVIRHACAMLARSRPVMSRRISLSVTR